MKKFSKLLLALGGISAVGAGLAVGMVSTQASTIEQAKADVTSANVRIWMARGGCTWWENDSNYQPLAVKDAAFSSTLADNTLTTSGITYYAPTSWIADGGYYGGGSYGTKTYSNGLMYYDVPLSSVQGKYLTFMRFDSSSTTKAANNMSGTGVLFSTTNNNNFIWRLFDNGSGIYLGDKPGVASDVLCTILSGYMTCSDNAYNGYGAFNQLNTTFSLTTHSFIDTDVVSDYGYSVETGEHDYTVTRGTGYSAVNVKASDKVAAMKAKYEAAGAAKVAISGNDSSSTLVLGGIAAAAVLAAGGYYFVRKKKNA